MIDGACEKCGIDLSEVADRRPQIELTCQHDGSLGLALYPQTTAITVHPGDAFEIRWRLNYPKDGGPPTITEIGEADGHWKVSQGDRGGTDAGVGTDVGANAGARASSGQGASNALEAFEGAGAGLAPDGFEKITGYRAWIISKDDDSLHSTAHRYHLWDTNGPEVAVCQKEHEGHHISYDLFRLREQAALVEDPEKRAIIQSNIDREIMTARRSPERNCQCGIYAVNEASEIIKRIGEQEGIVYGRVKAWGKIADYEKGFRAEKVEIDALFRPHGWLKRRRVSRIAKAYGVKVEAPPYSLPDPDQSYSFKIGAFWAGFLLAGGAGIVFLEGVGGYLVATMTYSLAVITLTSLIGRSR